MMIQISSVSDYCWQLLNKTAWHKHFNSVTYIVWRAVNKLPFMFYICSSFFLFMCTRFVYACVCCCLNGEWRYIYTVSQKKTSHFNFRHNFAFCWDSFTIFEALCSGLIAGWCNLFHTHHRCEAFTLRDVTYDVIQAVVRSAHWHRIS